MRTRIAIVLALLVLAARPVGAQNPPTPADWKPAPHPDTTATGLKYAPRVSGYIQVRETWAEEAGLSATLNRTRVIVEGPMPLRFSYRVQVEYESAPSNPSTPAGVGLRDAFIKWSNGRWAATAGQFKAPFGREYLMSITTLETPDRGLLEHLVPRRDIGVQAEWLSIPFVTVAAGVFNGEGQNAALNRDSTVMAVGRISARPVSHVTVGAAIALSGEDSTRIGFESGVAFDRLSLRGEYVRLTRDEGARDEGWYGLACGRVAPGLWLVVRREAIDRGLAGPSLTREDATTVGGYYDLPGGHMRAWLDWIHGKIDGEKEDRAVAQLQVRF